MKARPRMTLAEMAARSALTGGRLVCPRCGCADLRVDKTKKPTSMTYRHRVCRHCGWKCETRQPPEEFIREVEPRNRTENDYDDNTEEDLL